MKKNINYRITALIVTAILAMFIAAPAAGFYGAERPAIYIALIGSFVCFIFILDMKLDRVLKGVYLIGFGVLYQLIYPRYLFAFIDSKHTPPDALEHFEIFGQVILLACAGAGGSIIAAHADKTSIDKEPIPTSNSEKEKIIIDNTPHIMQLIKNTSTLNKKINILIATIALAASSAIILAIYLKN